MITLTLIWGIVQGLKLALKAAVHLRKIFYVWGHKETYTGDKIPEVGLLNNYWWKTLERNERCLRNHISSRKYNVGGFICKGDFKLWVKVFNILNEIFFQQQMSTTIEYTIFKICYQNSVYAPNRSELVD